MFDTKIKLVEVSECNLSSYQYGTCARKEPEKPTDISSMSIESARRILFKDFGGKKAMKVLDRKEKMKINVDVVKDQLDKTLLGMSIRLIKHFLKSLHSHRQSTYCFIIELNQSAVEKVDEFDEVKLEQDQILEDMVPKMNKDATKLVDVYSLTELIGKEILDSLNTEAITVLKTNPDDLPYVLKFFFCFFHFFFQF